MKRSKLLAMALAFSVGAVSFGGNPAFAVESTAEVSTDSGSVLAEDSSLVFGTATLSYTDYYAGDTSIAEYDAMSSATTKKNAMFPNEDTTEVTENGYQILGVKNVPVAVSESLYKEAQEKKEAGTIEPGSVYEKAAAITLNENPAEPTAQYKILQENGTYSATVVTGQAKITVNDAKVALKTTSNWGDYELDVTETSTKYIRNTRSDEGFEVNSNIMGAIIETTDGTRVGLRYMNEIWVQPYELAFNADTAAGKQLIGKTVNKIIYLMPNASYEYTFAEGVYIKPQAGEEAKLSAEVSEDLLSAKVDLSKLPEDLKAPKISVSYKVGRSTTYYAQEVELKNGVVTFTQKGVPNKNYTVTVSSENYADISTSVLSPQADIAEYPVLVTDSSLAYTGAALKPEVAIEGLVQETDFTVAYQNNVNPGTAEILIRGIGDYKGSKTVNFTITGSANPQNPVTPTNPVTPEQPSAAEKKTAVITASNMTKTANTSSFSLGAKTNSDGTLSYSSSNTKLLKVSKKGVVTLVKNATGKAKITIKAAETANYKAATKVITITVKAAKVSALDNVKGLKIVSKKAKKAVISWNKVSSAAGYEVQYGTNKSFKGAKTQTTKKLTLSLSKLKSGKKLYVRVRAYKTASGKKTYSNKWTTKNGKIK